MFLSIVLVLFSQVNTQAFADDSAGASDAVAAEAGATDPSIGGINELSKMGKTESIKNCKAEPQFDKDRRYNGCMVTVEGKKSRVDVTAVGCDTYCVPGTIPLQIKKQNRAR
jgi:hypothetical protein